MKIRRFLLVLIMAVMVAASTCPADAGCTLTGKVVYMYVPATSGTAYVYLAPLAGAGQLPTYYYYYTFSTDTIASLALLDTLNASMVANKYVYITGNASSCPSSGGIRNGGQVTGGIYVLY